MNDGFMIFQPMVTWGFRILRNPQMAISLVIAGSCQLLGDENSRNKICEQSNVPKNM
jgi:hypothetical protein